MFGVVLPEFVPIKFNNTYPLQAYFAPTGLKITSVDIDLPEFQGDPDFVAREKCREAYRRLAVSRSSGRPFLVFTEDTSLCVDAMGGLPGPYIKWFFEKLGHVGMVDMVRGFGKGNNQAEALTIVAATGNVPELFDSASKINKDNCGSSACNTEEPQVKLFTGSVRGSIVDQELPGNFWEANFLVEEEVSQAGQQYQRAFFSQMDSSEEYRARHYRFRALAAFREFAEKITRK